MPRSPMDVLFESADMRCVVCGKPSEGDHSKCFVTLKCTKCGDTSSDWRIPEYGDLNIVECVCPTCSDKEQNKG